jgi:hypothetical protein
LDLAYGDGGPIHPHCRLYGSSSNGLPQYSLALDFSDHGSKPSISERSEAFLQALSISERSEVVDVGNLSLSIDEQDAKIKSLEREITTKFTKQEDKMKALEREVSIAKFEKQEAKMKALELDANNLTQQISMRLAH